MDIDILVRLVETIASASYSGRRSSTARSGCSSTLTASLSPTLRGTGTGAQLLHWWQTCGFALFVLLATKCFLRVLVAENSISGGVY
jgi:hypothetical protein